MGLGGSGDCGRLFHHILCPLPSRGTVHGPPWYFAHSKAGADPNRPTGATIGQQGKEHLFPYPEENCGCFSGPKGSSGSHFGAAGAVGERGVEH